MNAKLPEPGLAQRTSALALVFVLSLATGGARAAPVFQDVGDDQFGTGDVTVPWPANHEIGDIALLFIESVGVANLGTPAGFVNVTNSPQSTGATRLTVYWARATSTSMASPTITDAGNHIYAVIVTYRDALEAGSPWSVTGGGADGSADTNADVSSISPTHADTLVVQAVAIETDSATPAFGTPTNVNLAGIQMRSEVGTTLGNGGGIAIWDGVKAAAGATGTTTLTTPSSDHAFLSIALRPTTTYYSRVVTGNWATGTTWSTAGCGGASAGATPVAGSKVVICSGHTITLNTNSAAVRNLTIQSTGVLNIGNDGTARTLTVTGAVSNAGTLRYNTAAAHVANFGSTFVNSGTVTTAAVAGNKSLSVTGLLTNSGTFDLAGNGVFTLNANGGLTNDNSLSFTTAQNHVVNVTGDFSNTGTVTAGAVAGTKTITVSGLTTNSGTLQLAGNGVFTLNANGGLTNSNSMSFTTGQNHAVNVTGAFNNSGTFTSGAVGGARTLTVSGLITNTGTLRFAGTAAMTVNANGGVTNGNTLDVSAASNTTHQLNVGGDFTNDGTVNFVPDGDSFVATTFNGGAAQNITGTAGSTTFYNLTLNNANGLTLSGTHNATVSNTLTLSSGRLTTGSNVVSVSSGNAVAGAGANTFVVGNLRKEFVASANVTRAFEVGTETGGVRYAPVTVTLANVTGAGGLTVSTTAGDHANIAASTLDPVLSINRYWTLSGNSAVFDDDANNSITFTFVDPDDYDPGADFNAFLVGRYDGSWTEATPTNVTNTTATISDTDVSAATIDGDYQVAEALIITPSSGITVTLNEAASEINAGSLTLTNTTLGPPELTATNTNSTSQTITTNIAATIANSWLVDIVGSGDAGGFVDQTPSQPETWDESAASATGAMSTKTVVGASSMTQDFGVAANRMAHAVMLVPPLSGATIIFDGAASSGDANVNALNWNHPLGTVNLTRAKIIVGVVLEDEDCTIAATAVTYGNVQLTLAAEAEIDTGLCMRVELWWGDLTPIIINTSSNSTLGGQAMDQDEAVRYTPVANTGTLFIDDALFAPLNPNIDGLSLLSSGNIALSFTGNVTFQGNPVEDGDIFEMTPTGDFVQYLFDENSFNADEDVDAAHVRDNGNIILSTGLDATFVGGAGGLSMDDDDLVEWNPGTGTATLFFDLGSVVGAGFNVDGVTLLDDDPDLILFSLTANATLGGVNYLDGDVVLYDRNTGNFSRYFSESNFTSGNEQTSAFTLPRAVVIPPPIAQFDISYGATGSTCLSSEILITAEDIGGNAITNYGGTVALSTSTGNGDWSKLNQSGGASSDPALGTLSPGANDSGAADYTFLPTDLGTIALFLSNQHAESLTITVFDSTAGVFSTSVVPLTFSDNVFVITPNTCTGGTCPGTGSSEVVAGRDHAFGIAMYRRDISQNPANCGVATNYTGPRNLKAWISRNGSDPGGSVPSLAEQTGALGDGAAPVGDNLALDFTATPGQSSFTLQTADVGKYTINVRDDSGTFAGVDIDGSSQVLTARPFGIGFTGLIGDMANPGAATPGGGVFAKAGADFAGVVRAYRWSGGDDAGNDGVPDPGADVTDNGLTSSYAWSTTVTALLNTPTAAQGGVLGPFNNGAVAQGSFSGGSASVANFQYLEVGSIYLDASATGYLGSGGVDISGRSGVVGRFAADHFDFVINTAPQLGAACTAFTYIDQGFDFSNTPQITARALDESSLRVLQNYHDFSGAGGDNWWLLDLGTGVAQSYADAAAPAGVGLVDAADYSPTSGSGVNGQVQFTLTGPFEYDDRSAAPYGPVDTFNAQVALDFTVTDSDGATGALNINPIVFPNPEQRWGRMIIGTAAGSELLPLAVPMRTEYFDGGAFVANADDACTSVAAAELVLTSEVEGPITGDTVQIRPGATTTATIANVPFVQGQAGLSFSSPGEGMTGYADITLDLGASGEDWLRFDRDGDGVPDNDPSGRAVFGIFGGNDRLIYTREPWN